MSTSLNTKNASELASRILVGARLDRITTYSIQVNLGFLIDDSTAIASGEVVVEFTCHARVGAEMEVERESESFEFFAGRSVFFAHAHGLIGEIVSSVDVQEDGALKVGIGNTSVHLWLSAEDFLVDDWIWKLTIEGDNDRQRSEATELYCCPDDNKIVFAKNG